MLIPADDAWFGWLAVREPRNVSTKRSVSGVVHWVRATQWPNGETYSIALACCLNEHGYGYFERSPSRLDATQVTCILCATSEVFLRVV